MVTALFCFPCSLFPVPCSLKTHNYLLNKVKNRYITSKTSPNKKFKNP
ncbi:MAG: hypothetical protein F6J98_41620 [Moorea sp. SIO4G2]|nr:hypothetical protein [Moorena sp. SIO4G2]